MNFTFFRRAEIPGLTEVEAGTNGFDNTYGERTAFFEDPIPPRCRNWKRIAYGGQPGKTHTFADLSVNQPQ